jgi:hypothetical protein
MTEWNCGQQYRNTGILLPVSEWGRAPQTPPPCEMDSRSQGRAQMESAATGFPGSLRDHVNGGAGLTLARFGCSSPLCEATSQT